MKKIAKIVIVFWSTFTFAQDNTLSLGGEASGFTGTVSFSYGQVFYENQIAPNYRYILQGLQQPYEFVTLSNKDLTNISLSMDVYPNPTTNIINLIIMNYDYKDLFYETYDINGRLIRKKTEIKNLETSIDLSQNPTGVYILKILKNNEQIKNFKIIKN